MYTELRLCRDLLMRGVLPQSVWCTHKLELQHMVRIAWSFAFLAYDSHLGLMVDPLVGITAGLVD